VGVAGACYVNESGREIVTKCLPGLGNSPRLCQIWSAYSDQSKLLRKVYYGSKREICAFGGVAGVGGLCMPAGAYRPVWRGASGTLLRSEYDERVRLREESGSFLKKRTKKLLVLRALASTAPKPAVINDFFASFFTKKEALAFFPR
jgi:hypothetical protein